MANKSTLDNLIDTNLADESNITAEEHREVENYISGSLFGVMKKDSNLTSTQVFVAVSGVNMGRFNSNITKSGNLVTGFIRFLINNSTLNLHVLSIVESEYIINSNIYEYVVPIYKETGEIVGTAKFTTDGKVILSNGTASGGYNYINFTYSTNQ